MSQKQKSKKANGFLLFMLDYKKNEASRGNEIDMNTAQLEAGNLWMGMSASEREKFSNKPSSSKSSDYKEPTKYTSFGVTFDEIDRQKEDERKKIQRMNLTIEEMLSIAKDQGHLETLPFYFFSTTEFVQTMNNDIFPAEIAMSKFCLKDGITKTMHMMVNPGKLPLGMAAEASIRASNVHKRDLPPKCDGESDYSVILSKMLEFMDVDMRSGKRVTFPPLFVEPGRKGEEYKSARMTLDKITVEAGEPNLEFRLFQTENLLQKLHKKCNERFEVGAMSLYLAKDMMNRDTFMYNSIGCDFHSGLDASHLCCLSKVQRWAFEIAKICNEGDHNFEMIPGKHFPARDGTVSDMGDVVSSGSRDSDWGSISDLSSSLKHQLSLGASSARINADETLINASANPAIAEESVAETATASNVDSESLHHAASFSHLIRQGRGGKNGRGGKRPV